MLVGVVNSIPTRKVMRARYIYISVCDTSSTGSNLEKNVLLLAVSEKNQITYIEKSICRTVV